MAIKRSFEYLYESGGPRGITAFGTVSLGRDRNSSHPVGMQQAEAVPRDRVSGG